jgi:DNA-binding NarL/FixJ family response regulator
MISKIRVLIVEDHMIVATGLQSLLEAEKGFDSSIASRGYDALLLLEEAQWDVVLLDILLPDMNGMELLAKIKDIQPETKVIILTGESDEHYGVQAFKAGCNGYLRKNVSLDEIVTAIKAVVAGEAYMTPYMAEHLSLSAAMEGGEVFSSLGDFSCREYEVAQWLVSGKSLKEICQKLGLDRQTILTYRQNILDKLGA